MALERPPKYAQLNPEMIKSFRPSEDGISVWHTVTSGRHESLQVLATRYGVPVEQIIEFNFPGSVENGRVIPEIVNWYLHHHTGFGCPETPDRKNRIFKGGEKVAIPYKGGKAPAKPARLPTLAEATEWFKEKVIPRRTTVSGFSGNRLWKTPMALVRGNTEDPNGLCGDTTSFVAEEYYRQNKDYRTSDGYIIGMVLYEGSILNHIANVMLVESMIRKETYTYDSKTQTATATDGKGRYDTPSLFRLQVFDLYYKQAQDLRTWWKDQDSDFGGTITIGLQHDFT